MKKIISLVCMLLLVGTASAYNWNASIEFGLFSYWNFDGFGDGNNSIQDVVGGGYNWTSTGAGSYKNSSGLIGNMTCLNGSDFWYINESDSDGNADVFDEVNYENSSVSIWIKSSTDAASSQGLFSKFDPPSTGFFYALQDDETPQEGDINFFSTKNVANGSWHHIVWVMATGTNQAHIYIDGVLNATTSYSLSNENVTQPLGLGARCDDASCATTAYPYTGCIDEIGFWNRTLSSTEVIQLYNFGLGLQYIVDVAPTVTLNSPSNGNISISKSVLFNCSAIDDGIVENISLIIDGTVNETFVGSGSELFLEKTLTLNSGKHTWNCNATDDENNISTATQRELTVGVQENSITFNATTYEMRTENIILNITYNNSITDISASLVYNGTSYSATEYASGTNVVFIRSLDIPLTNLYTDINRSFYWEIQLTEGASTYFINSSSNNQTISPVVFSICNGTYITPIVNYTIYDENNLSLVPAELDVTFDYWTGSGSVIKNYSFNAIGTNSSWAFCTNQNITYYTDAVISLEAAGYNPRNYYLNNQEYNNLTTNKSLYLLPDGNGTNVIIEVTNSGLSPLANYSVIIERYYASTGAYLEIFEDVTDDYGQVVPKLIENDVKYRFKFKNSQGTLVKQTSDMTIACRSTICVLPFVIEDTTDDFDRFTNVTDLDWSLVFDNSTNIFTFSWTDNTGDTVTYRLYVQRVLFNGTTVICNSSTTSISSSLTCDTSGIEATYIARAYRSVSGEESIVAVLNVKVGEVFDTYGFEGLIWTFILLMTMLAIGAFNPPLGVLLYNVGFIIMGLIGIVQFNLPIFFATNIIMVLFIWAYRS